MPEETIPVPNIEQAPAPLESDLERLAGEFAKHKENPEMAGAPDREVVRQAIRSMAPVPAQEPSGQDDGSVLPNYMGSATPAAKMEVEELIRLAFKDGVAKATASAQRSNPFILDAFHDALAGRLHEELKKRKLI